MLAQQMTDAINEQIKHEMYASHLYLSMAAYLEARNVPGMSHWMRMQSEEERDHALKFFDYLIDRGADVKLQGVDAPSADFSSLEDVFQRALEHEQRVTQQINALYQLANQLGEYPTMAMLSWFLSEQVEEEKNAMQVLEDIRRVGDHPTALFFLDREMARRAPEGAGGHGHGH